MFKFIILLSAVVCLGQAFSTARGSGKLVKLGLKHYWIEPYAGLDFVSAVEYCNIHHLGLTAIENEEENYQLSYQVNGEGTYEQAYLWTSGSRLNGDEWLWLTTGKPIEYFDWETQPAEDQRCLSVGMHDPPRDYGWWVGLNCEEKAGVICETADPDPQQGPELGH